jgi:pimeloyl-ACP methyl ester carboxylesterase
VSRIGLFIVALLVLVMPAGAATAPGIALERCGLLGGVAALCGRFDVPEDRTDPGGRSVSLRVAVIPAREHAREPDPLVYITGGPGGSAVDDAIGVLSIFRGLNAHRDILLVDQRGTGGSNKLLCPVPQGTALMSTEAALKAYVRGCLAGLDADPTQYTTAPAMDDLAEVVSVLGYERVNLYGVSYGGTAAQYFLAQHPELVRSAIP